MTLKEKIADEYIWTTEPIVDIEEVNNSINKMEQIADDYAIEFMNWCIKNYDIEAIFMGILDDKELLEIYKKEKGL